MIELTVNDETVQVHSGDIVRDTLNTSVGIVPFEWSTGFNVNDAVAAIDNYLAQSDENPPEPIEVESTGEGWIIDLPSQTHPQAEITDIDFNTDLINFRWKNSAYSGDCAVEFTFTLDTLPQEVAGAIANMVSGE